MRTGRRRRATKAQLREPGHQFEWVWLLHEFHRHTKDDSVAPYAERLFAFGSTFGIERGEGLSGAVFDGVDASGALVAGTKTLWPQTEYIKACVARAEWLGDEAARARGHVASRADRAALHAPRRRQLAQSAHTRRHAADAGHARARAVSFVLCVAEAERFCCAEASRPAL